MTKSPHSVTLSELLSPKTINLNLKSADREAVLRYVLAVGPRAASPRFEVFAEAGPVPMADGSDGGRQFALVEVIDLARPGEADRLRAELDERAGERAT